MQPEFQAFLTDEISYASTYGWAGKQGFPAASVQRGGVEVCATHLEKERAARCLVVDIDGALDPVSALGQLRLRCGGETRLVALGTTNDVALYRQLLAVGVADYIVKPVTPEQLTQALTAALRSQQTVGAKEAKIIVIVGARGGVGASTLAINMAAVMAQDAGAETALLDLDMQFGTAALALDLEPGRGLREIVTAPERVDSLMIGGAAVKAFDRLTVFAAEEPLDEAVPMDHEALSALINDLRKGYDAVVVDLPRALIPTQKRLLTLAQEIVILSELSLVGIRDTLRVKTLIKGLGAPARVTLAGARLAAQRPAQVDEATFAKGVHAKLDFKIPEDTKLVAEASNNGKCLHVLAPQAALTKTIRQLALHVGVPKKEVPAAKGGILSRLFGSSAREPERL